MKTVTMKDFLANYGVTATDLALHIEKMRKAAIETDRRMGFPISRMKF